MEYVGVTREGIKSITHKVSAHSAPKSAANLWRKASSPAEVHLLNLQRISGVSIPTDPRQYETRQLYLLLQLVLPPRAKGDMKVLIVWLGETRKRQQHTF